MLRHGRRSRCGWVNIVATLHILDLVVAQINDFEVSRSCTSGVGFLRGWSI